MMNCSPGTISSRHCSSHSVVPSDPMMTEVAAMSSQTATETQKRTGPMCSVVRPTGSRATGRFEKDARMDLELIVCECPPYRCCFSAPASPICLVIIIAGFLILASVLTAVEPCRSSCRFGNAAAHRLLQSSANSQLLYPGGRSRKPRFLGD
jgi:hypothetical protein